MTAKNPKFHLQRVIAAFGKLGTSLETEEELAKLEKEKAGENVTKSPSPPPSIPLRKAGQ